MTIEQEFYKCFEIEKRCLHPKECRHKGICRGVVACDHYTYPPITDRILLELICIANKNCIYGYSDYGGCYLYRETIVEIKESLLTDLIHNNNKVYKQVQQLFKEYE